MNRFLPLLLRLIAFCLAVGATVPAAADRLIDNVDGWTVDENGLIRTFNGLLIDNDGRVKKLLQPGDDRPRKKDLTIVHDGGRKIMLPGLIDGQIDLGEMMRFAIGFDLHGISDPSDLLGRLSSYSRDNPRQHWLIGQGWSGDQARALDKNSLDSVLAARPVLLFDAGTGFALANSRALELLGLTGDGRLSGAKLEQARANLPKLRPLDQDNAFAKVQGELLAAGITGLSAMGTDIEQWQVLRRAGDEARLNLRISAYASDVEQMALIAGSRPTPWLYDDRLRLSGLYLMLDRPMQSGGAWLNTSATDQPSDTKRLMRTSELRNSMVRAAMDGFSVVLGAYGDAAVAEAIAALDELAPTYPDENRWRISGLDVTPAGAGDALARYRLTVEAGRDDERWLIGRGVADGSFGPVGAIQSYSNAIPVDDLARRTIVPARAGEMDRFTGSLMPGKWADFILFAPDPMMRDNFPATVEETWLAGKPVWRRSDQQSAAEGRTSSPAR